MGNTNSGAGTGAIQDRSLSPIKWFNGDAVTFLNSGAAVKKGQVVRITGDYTVGLKTAANHIGIGIAQADAADGDNIAIIPVLAGAEVSAVAKGGTLNAGTTVRADGTLGANGLPNYIAATTTGDFADGVVLKGGAAAATITVLLFNSLVKI